MTPKNHRMATPPVFVYSSPLNLYMIYIFSKCMLSFVLMLNEEMASRLILTGTCRQNDWVTNNIYNKKQRLRERINLQKTSLQ